MIHSMTHYDQKMSIMIQLWHTMTQKNSNMIHSMTTDSKTFLLWSSMTHYDPKNSVLWSTLWHTMTKKFIIWPTITHYDQKMSIMIHYDPLWPKKFLLWSTLWHTMTKKNYNMIHFNTLSQKNFYYDPLYDTLWAKKFLIWPTITTMTHYDH